MPDLSVILCTHNPRPDYLRRTLESLAAQTLSKEHWELLIVDNASEQPLAKSCDIAWHPHGRHVREDRLGVTFARVCGINESTGQLLLFVDDDTLLVPDYLENVLTIAVQHPYLGAIGAGIVKPEYEIQPPTELDSLLFLLVIRNSSSPRWSNNPKDPSCVPFGAGLCVHRKIAEQFTALVEKLKANMVLGRKGKQLFAHEDDLFSWVASGDGEGFGIFPELRITHLITAARLNQAYFLRLIYYSAFSHWILHYLFAGEQPKKISLSRCFRIAANALRRGIFSARCQWAEAKGEDQAARFILENHLLPAVKAVVKSEHAATTVKTVLKTTDNSAAGKQLQPDDKPSGAAPLISVVIPVFDRAYCVANAVKSVFAQTFKDFEVIVVDDGSTDGTAEVLSQFGDRIRLIRQEHRGASAARNAGIRAARGSWTAFLDSDDQWHSGKLERQIACLQKYGGGMCFTRCVTDRGELWKDVEDIVSKTLEPGVYHVEDAAVSICEAPCHPLIQTLMVEKKLLEQAGLFDESLHNAGDTELLFKLSFLSGFIYISHPLVVISRNSPNSLTYDSESEAAAKRQNSYMRVQAEIYWRMLELRPEKISGTRNRMAYFISRRAELACAAGQFQLARAMAKDGIYFAGDFRTRLRCAAIYLSPFLSRALFRRKQRNK